MRLTTWNVNGIRNPFGYQPWSISKTFSAMFDILEADIVVMQELKIQRKDLRDDMVLNDGWDCYFSLPKHKKGYSGVGIYTRNATCAPIRAEEGLLGVLCPPNSITQYRDLPESQHIGGYPSELQIAELGVDPALLDAEGRCVCLEFPAFVLFGVYSPANSNGLRDDFRYGFLGALDCRIRNLVKMGKRVVLVGDLNVSRSEIDTASALEDIKKAGLTHEDYVSTPNRRIFNQMLFGGDVVGERDEGRETPVLVDVVREFHPDRKGMYTHWEQKINARPGNYGSRIDYVLASHDMEDWFVEANIQEGLMGSDHCPVYGVFKNVVTVQALDQNLDVHLLDIMNPPGMFVNGQRQREWNTKDIPAFSGRLLPEFDKRRSIKDMFKKPSTANAFSGQTASPTKDALPTGGPASVEGGALSATPTGSTAPGSAVRPLPAVSPTATSTDKKRKASDAPVSKTTKRTKSNPSASAKQDVSRGQQSLKGFLVRESNPQPSRSHEQLISNGTQTTQDAHVDLQGLDVVEPNVTNTDAAVDLPSASEAHPSAAFYESPSASSTAPPHPPLPPLSPSQPSAFSSAKTVHDPIVSKESWTTLFRKPAAPLCEGHGEPCKSMLTRKKGENQGRSFWMCARPLGPSGAKETGTQWRCKTFIWSSDWKGEGVG